MLEKKEKDIVDLSLNKDCASNGVEGHHKAMKCGVIPGKQIKGELKHEEKDYINITMC